MPDGEIDATWPPRVWLLMGHKAGDNSQVLALGEAIGWPFEIKRFAYRKHEFFSILQRVTLAGTVKSGSSPLGPPWPDLVLSAGRRNEPVARWIKRQAAKVGKRVKLVHVGRPWAHYDNFELVVTTPQYRLPRRPNVLHNATPLHRVTEDQLDKAAAQWASRLGHLARPYIAVVVGGSSGPYSMDRRTAERLGREASAMAERLGGSLLVTTSARTSVVATEALQASITCPAHFFPWSPEAAENPYFGYLGLADSIIVTGDSMSMLTEACATRKPVFIFDLGEGRNSMRLAPGPAQQHDALGRDWRNDWDKDHPRASIYRLGMRIAPRRLTRDIRIVHQGVIASGRAVWLGDSFPPGPPPPPLECVSRAVARVRALFRPAAEARPEMADEGNEKEELISTAS